MPTRTEIERRRIAEAEKAAKATNAIVRGLQNAAYGLVTDWVVGNIETDGGRIKYTTRNLGRVQSLFRLFERFQREYRNTLLGSVLDWAVRLFGLNRDYFESFTDPSESVTDAARAVFQTGDFPRNGNQHRAARQRKEKADEIPLARCLRGSDWRRDRDYFEEQHSRLAMI